MHQPVMKTHRKRIGLTGDIRVRTQRFTGKQILQVAVIYEVMDYRYPHELKRKTENSEFRTEVEWEDADASAGLRLACGFPPFERKQDKAAIIQPSHAPMWGTCPGHQEFDPKVYRK